MNKSFRIVSVIALSILFSIAISGLAGCSSPRGNQNPEQPNIVIIMTDDQPPHTLAYMPVLQKEIIAKGVNFSLAYATTPLCCPSRASILSGLYAQHTGVLTNRPGAPEFVGDDDHTVATWLQQAGYRTGYIGKYLNNIDVLGLDYRPAGWDDYQILWDRDKTQEQFSFFYGYLLNNNGELLSYGHDEKDYSTDVFTTKAREFIKASGEQPFFLMVSYYAPHYPYDSAKRHEDLFRTEEDWSAHWPPNFAEEDLSDKPEWLRNLKPLQWNNALNADQAMLRSLMAVDEGIQDILDLLDERQVRDNTIIIFLSDNGMSVGEHHIIGKDCPYEACIRTPLVVVDPRLEDMAREETKFALNIDIAPTLLEYANIPNPGGLDGTSLVPLLRDPQAEWREHVFIEHYKDGEADDPSQLSAYIPTYWAIRTSEWKYVEYQHGEMELYDMLNDPYELQNLAYQPEYADLIAGLSETLRPFRFEP